MSRLQEVIDAAAEVAAAEKPGIQGSRELSIVKTKLDEARLWEQERLRVKGRAA